MVKVGTHRQSVSERGITYQYDVSHVLSLLLSLHFAQPSALLHYS